ncbi:hypothetical protein Trydic_g15332 [Trypoxylus dichotomus]
MSDYESSTKAMEIAQPATLVIIHRQQYHVKSYIADIRRPTFTKFVSKIAAPTLEFNKVIISTSPGYCFVAKAESSRSMSCSPLKHV